MAGEAIPSLLATFVDASAGANACHPYKGTRNRAGYGVLPRAHQGSRLAHRAVLSLVLGRPVSGVTRHTCDNPPCCNPAHLAEGTTADNANDMFIRGRARGGRAEQTHCIRGHEMTPENTRLKQKRSSRREITERVCRTCQRDRNQRDKARRRAAGLKD